MITLSMTLSSSQVGLVDGKGSVTASITNSSPTDQRVVLGAFPGAPSVSAQWTSVDKPQRTIPPGTTEQYEVRFDTTGASPGTYPVKLIPYSADEAPEDYAVLGRTVQLTVPAAPVPPPPPRKVPWILIAAAAAAVLLIGGLVWFLISLSGPQTGPATPPSTPTAPAPESPPSSPTPPGPGSPPPPPQPAIERLTAPVTSDASGLLTTVESVRETQGLTLVTIVIRNTLPSDVRTIGIDCTLSEPSGNTLDCDAPRSEWNALIAAGTSRRGTLALNGHLSSGETLATFTFPFIVRENRGPAISIHVPNLKLRSL
jgi:hypothetical protein